ncbi:MAG: hypothetical protein CMJ76_04405 [Planctomycetaceae bacterium]|nr:hypothetical protein [Planctomycetaceae bacterium]|tara:strand:- start:2248 stop:3198 length:951 start_codon:yes stop_codon:yes gene_type:complete
MNDQPESNTNKPVLSGKKVLRFRSKSVLLLTFFLLLGITIFTGRWYYLRESVRQDERRQAANQLEQDFQKTLELKKSERKHPLDPILQIAYQSIKKMEATLVDYTAVLSRRERIGEQAMPPNAMEIKIRNPRKDQAFSIYLKFTEPESTKGREVIWVAGKNENKIVAHETGLLGLLRVVQPPDSFVAMVGNRYPVTETGLLRMMQKLTQYGERDRKHGDCEVEIIEEITVAEVTCTRLRIVHPEKRKPFTFHIAEIDMDMKRMIPIRLATWDWPQDGDNDQNPVLTEEYIYHNVKLNVGLSDIDFDPENPDYSYPN